MKERNGNLFAENVKNLLSDLLEFAVTSLVHNLMISYLNV